MKGKLDKWLAELPDIILEKDWRQNISMDKFLYKSMKINDIL